jgi:hypothetical protein
MDEDARCKRELLALLVFGALFAAGPGAAEAAVSPKIHPAQLPDESMTVEQRIDAVRARLKAFSPQFEVFDTAPEVRGQVAQWYNWGNWRNW